MKDQQRAGLVVLLSVICAFHFADMMNEIPDKLTTANIFATVLVTAIILIGIALLSAD